MNNHKFSLVILTSFIFCFLFFCCTYTALAQPEKFSEMYNEVQKQQVLKTFPIQQWDSLRCAWYGDCSNRNTVVSRLNNEACALNKRMFGWHVIGASSASYVWQSLSDLSYFSYQVDYTNGNASNASQLVNWGNNATVLAAKANGVKVNLAVTFFGTSTTFGSFFGNSVAQQTLITNLVNQVTTADVHGLNIDFEGSAITSTYLTQYIAFLSSLRSQLLAARPTAEISVDIQGAHAANSSYITQLNTVVDLLILMGYDYYWSSQNYPGPIAPTWQFPSASGDPYGHGNVANDLNSLLRYAPRNKVLLAMPYYGFRWKTLNGCTLPGQGDAPRISSQTYAQFRDNSNGYYTNTLRDPYSLAAYHCFTDAGSVPNQQFIDDVYSLQNKYDLIKQQGIAGGAVWKLGNDAGYPELWELVNNNLSVCAAMPCRDTIYDMGGPLNNYLNRSNYTFTINPSGAQALSLRFLDFNFETGFDSMWVYNGPDTLSPLIANLSGAVIPATLLAESGIMTIKIFTDGATTRSGFTAIYNCSPQTVRSIATGNWNNPAIWETGAVPLKYDTALIMPGHTVTVTSNQEVGQLNLSPSGNVNVLSTASLKVVNP